MRKLFAYNRNYGDEAFNNLIDCSLDLARATFDGKKAEDYSDKNKELLAAIGKYAVTGTVHAARYEAEGLDCFKSPMVHQNQAVRDNFNAVIAQIVSAYVPEVVNDDLERYLAEVKQVGYGDTARFILESNALFKVNQKAEGVRKAVDEPMYDTEYTLHAHPITISTHIDWYPFAAGIFDMGNFALKIARSFEAYIFLKAVKGMTQATTKYGAAYTINGVTPTLWGNLKQKVRAANGGIGVVAIGTEVALSNCNLGGNYQVEIGEEMNKVGYLDQYLGVPLIALKNVLIPNTANTTADLALPDDIMYFVPVAGDKPVKILFEGNEVAVTFNANETSDNRMGIDVTMRVGISAICGAKFGTVDL